MLPPDVRVARDSEDLLIECCVEFINLVSSESNEVCNKEDKRTIAPKHVLKALQFPVGRIHRQLKNRVSAHGRVGLMFFAGTTEKGTYYALHLGGTYFRILRVHLGGERSYLDVQDVERHPIPSHLMNSTSEVFSTFSPFPWKSLSKKKETGPIQGWERHS